MNKQNIHLPVVVIVKYHIKNNNYHSLIFHELYSVAALHYFAFMFLVLRKWSYTNVINADDKNRHVKNVLYSSVRVFDTRKHVFDTRIDSNHVPVSYLVQIFF